jgi:hypothetical protein
VGEGRGTRVGFVGLLLCLGACSNCSPQPVCKEACGTNKACFASTGSCQCKPGFVACGDSCVDIATDNNHCGSCAPCPHAHSCERGLCVKERGQPQKTAEGRVFREPSRHMTQVFPKTPIPDPNGPVVTVDPPTVISGYDATTTCDSVAEPRPELSLNTLMFPGSPPPLFTGYGNNNVNSATDWNTWPNTATNVLLLPTIPNVYPPCTSFPCTTGAEGVSDAWGTTSGTTGLDYVSQLLISDVSPNPKCLAIAATTPTQRATNSWQYPLSCLAGTFDDADRPTIAFDRAGTTLWAAQGGPIAGARLFIMQNCGAGSPGGPACPVTKTVDILGAIGHPGVTVDPCNHLGIVSFRSGDLAQLQFYTATGTLVQTLPLEVSPEPHNTLQGAFNQPTSCSGLQGNVPKCNTPAGQCDQVGTGCLRLASKIHVATQTIGAQCFAYVAYDISRISHTDNKTYMHAQLDVVDITTQGAAFQVTGQRIGNDFATFDSFASDVAAADTPTGMGAMPVGWFFYLVGGNTTTTDDPCHTTFEAIVSVDRFVSSTSVEVSATSFPTVIFSGYQGMGDYQATVGRGLPQGVLYPTWVQPVQMTSGSCLSCMGNQYSSAIMATRLHVP